MEKQVVKTSLEEISPLINGCLDNGLDVILTVTGNSMQPLLEHNRDQVVLQKPEASKLKKGDVPLYIRKNGQYVLHRIVAVNEGVYTMLGDAQTVLEKGIKPEQIVAVAKGFYRKGRFIDCNGAVYRCWVSLWWHLRRIRPYLLKSHRIVKKISDGKRAQ
ncbi:MAG: S24/S26 family peptidase [Oscillospiraceae bacterium]|jgi:signal peptidase|nr:S24/S26 family peptidase [Oscillospiraceae bacterium]